MTLAEIFPGYCRKLSIYETTLVNWKTILRLADQYKFTEVKNLAFREIDKSGAFDMSIVERIILYRKYDADRKYLETLYVELLARPEPLTLSEGQDLSLELALLISGARERLRASSDKLSLSDPLPETMVETIKTMVASMFWDRPSLPEIPRVTSSDLHKTGQVDTTPASVPSKGEYLQELLDKYQRFLTLHFLLR